MRHDPRHLQGVHSRRGTALVLALMVLVVLGILSGVFVRTGLARRHQLQMEERRAQAVWLAESGLDRATAKLAEDSAYRGETWEIADEELNHHGAAEVQIGVEPIGDDARSWKITVRAEYPKGALRQIRHTLAAQVKLPKRESDKKGNE